MPLALQLVSGFFTAAGAGTGVATPSTGDTFNVPSFSLTDSAYLEQVWCAGASTDFVRIRSPRMHDNNQGIRLVAGTTKEVGMLPFGTNQPLYPSDTPTVEIDETAAASGAISVLYGFSNLPGVNPRLASWSEVQPRIRQISGCEISAVTSGAIGEYGAGLAINSSFDNFEAGADYALLGYETSASVLSVAITGQDTGNLKVGGPGLTNPFHTRSFFRDLSEGSGRPYIPIIAANNKGSTIVQAVDVAAATATNVSLILALLG